MISENVACEPEGTKGTGATVRESGGLGAEGGARRLGTCAHVNPAVPHACPNTMMEIGSPGKMQWGMKQGRFRFGNAAIR